MCFLYTESLRNIFIVSFYKLVYNIFMFIYSFISEEYLNKSNKEWAYLIFLKSFEFLNQTWEMWGKK